MRDVEGGHGESLEDAIEILEQPVAKPPVERGERLVEQEHAWLGGESPCERDALSFSTREGRDRPALEAGEPDQLEQVADTTLHLRLRVAAHAQAERDISEDVPMREERVILEDHADPAPMWRDRARIHAVDEHAARVWPL